MRDGFSQSLSAPPPARSGRPHFWSSPAVAGLPAGMKCESNPSVIQRHRIGWRLSGHGRHANWHPRAPRPDHDTIITFDHNLPSLRHNSGIVLFPLFSPRRGEYQPAIIPTNRAPIVEQNGTNRRNCPLSWRALSRLLVCGFVCNRLCMCLCVRLCLFVIFQRLEKKGVGKKRSG